jgi:hypothetical protein
VTEQDDRRRALLGEEACAVAFELGFTAAAPPPDVVARVVALLAATATATAADSTVAA